MHLGHSEQSPEQVILVLGRRGAALLSGVLAGAVVTLGVAVAVLTTLYH